MINFVWDEAKAKSNMKKHVTSFTEAKSVFFDEFAVQFYDDEPKKSITKLVKGLN